MFWAEIINGLRFQIKYTWYSLTRWPSVIVLYLLGICVLGILEPLEIYLQKELIACITANSPILVIIPYFLVSVFSLFQGYASPIVQRIVGLKITTWIDGQIYRTAQNIPLELLDSTESYVKLDRANEAKIHISSGPALLMYSLSYAITLLITTIQLIKYPILLILYYVMGLVMAINNTYQKQESDKLRKSLEVDKRALRYFSKLLHHKNIMIEARVHGYDKYFFEKWEQLTDTFFQKQMRLKKKHVHESIGITMLQQIIGIIPLGILYFSISNHEMDIATYTLVTGLGTIITRNIGYLFNAFAKCSSCGIYTKDIEDVLTYKSAEREQIAIDISKPIINMQNVSFNYLADQPVLSHIDFKMCVNEIVAIVGENGSGKTTLSNLALGLYKPSSGKIFLFGTDTSNIDIDSRDIASPVFQDYTKYEFSVRENIGFGNIAEIDNDARLLNAITVSGFRETFDYRALTLDTFLGKTYERSGQELSGGEWQRIAIGRGIFGNSKLIVLDEPTASLDPLSEIRLLKHIKESLKNRAALIISHRIGICTLADRIIFMKQGRIIESGTHDELYKIKGEYYKFFNEQAQWYDWSDTCGT